jgi:hypothetical protein
MTNNIQSPGFTIGAAQGRRSGTKRHRQKGALGDHTVDRSSSLSPRTLAVMNAPINFSVQTAAGLNYSANDSASASQPQPVTGALDLPNGIRVSVVPESPILNGISTAELGAEVTSPGRCEIMIFNIDIETSPGKVETFQVKANVPVAIRDSAKQFWTNQLQFLAQEKPDQLPAANHNHQMYVQHDHLRVVKEGVPTNITDPGVVEACQFYATAQESQLKNSLDYFGETLRSSAPILSTGEPVTIAHGENTCYLAAAMQALLNDHGLLSELNRAESRLRPNDPKIDEKKKALKAIQALVAYCKTHRQVPASEMVKLREALSLIAEPDTELARNDSKQKDADDAFRLIETLILDNAPSQAKATIIRTLRDGQSTHEGNPDDYNGIVLIPLANTQTTSATDLINANLAKHAVSGKLRPAPSAAEIPFIAEETVFKSPPNRLDVTFQRYKDEANTAVTKIDKPVVLSLNMDIDATRFKTRAAEGKYELSTVIFHDGATTQSGHYTTLVRKIDASGIFHNYLCDDIAGTKTLTDEECNAHLKDHANEVYKAIFTKKDILRSTAAKMAYTAAGRTYATQKAQETTESPATPNEVVEPVAIREANALIAKHKNGNVHFKVVSGEITNEPLEKGCLVNFADEDFTKNSLSTVNKSITTAAQRVLQTENKTYKGKLLADGTWWDARAVITPGEKGKHRIIHVNAGSTEDQFKAAITKALEKAVEQNYHNIALPLIDEEGIGLQNRFKILQEIGIRFATQYKSMNVTVVLTEDQRIELELPKAVAAASSPAQQETPEPASPEAPAPSQQLLIAPPDGQPNKPITLGAALPAPASDDELGSLSQVPSTPAHGYEVLLKDMEITPNPIGVQAMASKIPLFGRAVPSPKERPPVTFSFLQYNEKPQTPGDTYEVQANSAFNDPIPVYGMNPEDGHKPYQQDFNTYVQMAKKDGKSKLRIVVKRSHDRVIDANQTQRRFEKYIQEMSQDLTQVELIVIPADDKGVRVQRYNPNEGPSLAEQVEEPTS